MENYLMLDGKKYVIVSDSFISMAPLGNGIVNVSVNVERPKAEEPAKNIWQRFYGKGGFAPKDDR